MSEKWKAIAFHRAWVLDCLVTELQKKEGGILHVRYTANVMGWTGFRIYEGPYFMGIAEVIQSEVMQIRERVKDFDGTVITDPLYRRYSDRLATVARDESAH